MRRFLRSAMVCGKSTWRGSRRFWLRNRPIGFERLEKRELLTIDWINQGSPAFDGDGFNAAFPVAAANP